MSRRRLLDDELDRARTHYSMLGVGIVVVGAFLSVGAGLRIAGIGAMGFGALVAALGTLAPASLCLAVARADEEYEALERLDENDDGI